MTFAAFIFSFHLSSSGQPSRDFDTIAVNLVRLPDGRLAEAVREGVSFNSWSFIPTTIIGKMVGKPLGWGPLNNQPHIHLI